MDEFRKLDPHMRSLALVGNFLQHWALVENKLNEVISKSLGLSSLSGVIVVKNIQFRDKTKIASTAIHIAFISSEDKKRYKHLIKEIAQFSLKRNIVAHEFFCANEDGNCVDFVIIKANGEIKFPKEIWSIDTFSGYFDEMDRFYSELDELLPKLRRASIAKALVDSQDREPTLTLGQLGLLGSLGHQPLEPLGSNPLPTNPETAGETPPKPRRKARPRKAS